MKRAFAVAFVLALVSICASKAFGQGGAFTPQNASTLLCSDSSGSGTAQTCSTTPPFTVGPGTMLIYSSTTANAGSLTINVNPGNGGPGAIQVRKNLGQNPLFAGDIPANVSIPIVYDGVFWELIATGTPALPLHPANVPQILTTIPSGGAAGNVMPALPGIAIDPRTTTTEVIHGFDRNRYVTFSNSASVAASIAQAGSGSGTDEDFTNNFMLRACNIGAGTVTITPNISTVSYTTGAAYTAGAASVALTTGQCISLYSDNVNYFGDRR